MILKNNSKISLDKFIDKALYDKSKGYYINKNPIGKEGDFINYVKGANIAGFIKVADSMLDQGVV